MIKETKNVNTKTQYRFSAPTIAALLVVSVLLSILVSFRANAATLTQVEVRFDRMKSSTATTGFVCAKPSTTSADVKTWTVTFPTGYTVSTTASNWQTANISTSNLPAGSTAWPNATSATASVSGQTVTWTNASAQSMNNSTLYCYYWTSSAAVSTASGVNSSLAGTVATQNSSAATIDTGNYTTATIADDQITVTATVPSTFSFSLSSTTDNLPTLTTANPVSSTATKDITVNTNAKNGWQVWAKSAATNGGLVSSSASHTIPSTCSGGLGTNTTLSNAAEGYNTGVTATIGSGPAPSINAVFDGSAQYKGGGLCGAFQSLATSTGVATNAVLSLTNNASIVGSTPAATDYTDTITVVGAGLF